MRQVNKMDLYDAHTLASGYLDWIAALLTVAKKSDVHKDTLLDIAYYLADSQSVEFAENAKQFE
ncbi:hypothetical protein [Moraxella ovis]|uniref:hypothetical protein n=1 Tax=Moraxella ovis TaxID=29433 RepID=UPI000D8AB611|nr:hypothetical protein [Moraxella ovis]SPX85332.1 Uncharacterised protein [Moraxella ovis]